MWHSRSDIEPYQLLTASFLSLLSLLRRQVKLHDQIFNTVLTFSIAASVLETLKLIYIPLYGLDLG